MASRTSCEIGTCRARSAATRAASSERRRTLRRRMTSCKYVPSLCQRQSRIPGGSASSALSPDASHSRLQRRRKERQSNPDVRRDEDSDARRVVAAPLLVEERRVPGVADLPLPVDLRVLIGVVGADANVPLLTGVEEEVVEHPGAPRRGRAEELDLGMAAVVDAEGARLLAERRAEELHDRVDALKPIPAAPVIDCRVRGKAGGELVPALLV